MLEQNNEITIPLLKYLSERIKSSKDVFRIGVVFEKGTLPADSFSNLHEDMKGFSVKLNLDLVSIKQLNSLINDLYKKLRENNGQ